MKLAIIKSFFSLENSFFSEFFISTFTGIENFEAKFLGFFLQKGASPKKGMTDIKKTIQFVTGIISLSLRFVEVYNPGIR